MRIYNSFNFKENQWYTTDGYEGGSVSWIKKDNIIVQNSSYADIDIIIDLATNEYITLLADGQEKFNSILNEHGLFEQYMYFRELDFDKINVTDIKFDAIFINEPAETLIIDYYDTMQEDEPELLQEIHSAVIEIN